MVVFACRGIVLSPSRLGLFWRLRRRLLFVLRRTRAPHHSNMPNAALSRNHTPRTPHVRPPSYFTGAWDGTFFNLDERLASTNLKLPIAPRPVWMAEYRSINVTMMSSSEQLGLGQMDRTASLRLLHAHVCGAGGSWYGASHSHSRRDGPWGPFQIQAMTWCINEAKKDIERKCLQACESVMAQQDGKAPRWMLRDYAAGQGPQPLKGH